MLFICTWSCCYLLYDRTKIKESILDTQRMRSYRIIEQEKRHRPKLHVRDRLVKALAYHGIVIKGFSSIPQSPLVIVFFQIVHSQG